MKPHHFVLLLGMLCICGSLALRADEYDTLRARWNDFLVSYSPLASSDPDVASALRELADDGQSLWGALNKSPSASSPDIFPTLPLSGGTTFENNLSLNRTYSRLQTITRAWATAGCVASDGTTISGNATLAADLKRTLDWLYSANYYSPSTPFPTGDRSGFYIKIQIPLFLHDICVLLYGQLTTTQLNNYTNSTAAFMNQANVVEESGGNKVWIDTNHALYGVLRKDSSKLTFARDYLSAYTNNGTLTPSVFSYTDWAQAEKTGFYFDGSFIQHDAHPYTGGYGATLIFNLARVVALLDSSTSFKLADPGRFNVYHWIYDSYEPLLYRGAVLDSVRGREISRQAKYDHVNGHIIIEGILRLAESAPEPHASAYRAMVSAWLDGDPRTLSFPAGGGYPDYTYSKTFYADAGVASIALAKSYTGGARRELVGHYGFASMNRVMHLRPGWGLGLSFFSNRIYNYESLQPLATDPTAPVENNRGYFTGDGMTTLYNADVEQFSDVFWPTINPSRLPGITVDTLARHDGSSVRRYNGKSWAGGASLDYYGIAALDFDPPDHTWDDPTTGTNPDINQPVPLVAKKAWFMFDDEVVALGAGITGPAASVPNGGWDGATPRIETIIENRRLAGTGLNALKVNNVSQLTSFSTSEAGSSFASTTRAHLAGNVGGDDLGYYFPAPVTLKAARFARDGAWPDINDNASDTTVYTRNYLTLWLDHGSSPSSATYAYALLPGKTAAEVETYNSSPQFTVVQNNTTAQIVKENTLGVTAAALWVDGSTSYLNNLIKADKKAALIIDENSRDLDIGVAEPTFAGTGTMTVEVNKAATATLYLDPAITLIQSTPTIKYSFPVAGTFGRTLRARFQTASSLEFFNAPFDSETAGSAPAGWTVTASGGSSATIANVPSSSDRSVFLDDTSSTANVVLASPLGSPAEPQNGAVLAEFRMRVAQNNKAVDAGSLRDGSDTSTSAIGPRVIFRATGKITYYDGSTPVDTDISYAANTWYRFRLLANPARQRYSLWVDDVLKAADVPFYARHATLDRITFGTINAADLAGTYVDNVVVRRYSPLLDDSFSAQTPGTAPLAWNVVGTGNTAEVAVLPGTTTETGVKFTDTSASYGIEATTDFATQAGSIIAAYRVYPTAQTTFVKAGYLSDGTVDAVQVYFKDDGTLRCSHGSSSTTLLSNFPVNRWYHFVVAADASTDTATVTCYVDNDGNGSLEEFKASVNFKNAVTSLSSLLVGINTTTSGTAYLDDVRIYR
ncbi:MAG: polysaccharide lyase 8 family protein [Verrucomicrobiota bacterium]